jgi:Zn-dependent peptidase ImmA (M78 family)
MWSAVAITRAHGTAKTNSNRREVSQTMETSSTEHSVLAQLRVQRCGYKHGDADAARELAERQAALLLALTGNDSRTVDRAICGLPRITVTCANIPTSGLSLWDGHQWIITLNRHEPRTRQRFTLAHEYKHIVDHPSVEWLYRDRPGISAARQAERAADYFAGCVLVPRHHLHAAWSEGIQELDLLARYFAVSVRAISVRLGQVGLTAHERTSGMTPAPGIDASDTLIGPTAEGLAA